MSGRCRHCGQPFEYEQETVACHVKGRKVWRRVVRKVCDLCHQARKNWLHKRSHAKQPRALGINAKPGEFRDRNDIAREMGLTKGQLQGLELAALQKLRNSPELRAAYDNFKDEGMPFLDQLMASLRRPGADRLLEHQLELVEFWRVYGEARAAGLTAESVGILDEIARCHGLIARELRECGNEG